jgi:hypothetical protein
MTSLEKLLLTAKHGSVLSHNTMFDAQIGGNLKSNARTELSDRK